MPSIIAKFIKENSDPIFEICAWSDHYGSDGRTCGDPELSIVLDWYGSNTKEFYEAVVNGYTVKQEPKYIVKLPMVNWNDEASELQDDFAFLILDITSDETRISGSDKDFKTWIARLTEREIKSIDERYWAFAVPVDGSVEEV